MATIFRRKEKRRLRIVKNGHPALRQMSAPIEIIDDTVTQLAAKMITTMVENDIPGVGLAAPQVGINKRLIVIDTRSDDDPPESQLSPGEVLLNPHMPVALVNPEIVSASETTETASEGCLSLPGVNGDVTRPQEVVLKGTLLNGEQVLVPCRNLLCRCLQHEIDHLNGVLFIDKSPENQRKAAAPVLKKLAKEEQKYIPKNASLHDRTSTPKPAAE